MCRAGPEVGDVDAMAEICCQRGQTPSRARCLVFLLEPSPARHDRTRGVRVVTNPRPAMSDEKIEKVRKAIADILQKAVAVNAETTVSGSLTFSEWVRDHAVAGLKANLGLEGVLSDRTYHL